MGELLPESGEVPVVPTEDFENFKFDFTSAKGQSKIVFTVYGHKGCSKTYGTFCITTGRIGGFVPQGRTIALMFDQKTETTRQQWFPNDNIVVFDGKRYYSKDPKIRTKSGYMTYKYLLAQLANEEKIDKPDWVVIDGFTEVAEIFEMAMRYINGLKPTQGFANRNIWKDRGAFIQAFHDAALRCARYGVIYTTYSDKEEIIQDGEIVLKADIPKYVDVVMRETDVVLKVTKSRGKDGDIFLVTVESTKFKKYLGTDGKMLPIIEGITLQQGRMYNITDLAEKKLTPAKAIIDVKATPVQEPVKIEEPKQIEQPKPEIKPSEPAPIIVPDKPKAEPLKVTPPPVQPKTYEAPNINTI